MRLELLSALNTERAARRVAVIVTDVTTGAQRLVRADDVAADPLAAALTEHIAADKSGTVTTADAELFLTTCVPPPRLVIAGAVHVAQALASLAHTLGFDVIIVDPRDAFATRTRFPQGVRLLRAWPLQVLGTIALDSYTAVVALSHEPRIDDPTLLAALRCDCFYVGVLGSRRTQERRIERLREQGVAAADMERIHGPAGLPIGAATPAEIALAILAEITAARRHALNVKRG